MLVNNKTLQITQQNNYPWDGGLAFIINPASAMEMNLKIRIPGWAQNQAVPSDLYSYQQPLNKKVEIKAERSTGRIPDRTWLRGDQQEMEKRRQGRNAMPMDVQRVMASEKLPNDAGRIALQRGPLMYAAEWKDNGGKATNIIIPKNAVFTSQYDARPAEWGYRFKGRCKGHQCRYR
jgi:DUF1680 family protein